MSVIYWQVTFPDRMEAQLHRLHCELAQQQALSQSDQMKANLLAATARVVCQGR